MFNIQLNRARKAAGLSLRALAELTSVSHTAIKKYEDAKAVPSSDILLRLSRALNVRTEYFFRREPVVLDGIEYRKRSSLPQKSLNAITYKVMDQIERRIELENLFPQSPIKIFSNVWKGGIITTMDQIEDVSDQVREAWKLGFDPIPDLIDVLESNGIRVFMIETDENKFDGLAANVGGAPIVVVGKHWPGDRQRFTLVHELGHLILKNYLSNDLNEEKACNRFAGAFLLPRTSIVEELGQHRNAIELKELGLLKDEFGLSMAGILYRAHDLGIISPAYRKEQNKIFSINGWRRKEPGQDYPSEKAHIFEQLIFHALAEEYIGESKAAELMNLPLLKFRSIRSMEPDNVAANQ